MLRGDKFLLGIVIAVVALVVVAFIVAVRQPPPTYRADDTADAIAYNYLLALQDGDYERAYGYLSPSVPGYPATLERFIDDVTEQGGGTNFGSSGTSSFRVDPPSAGGDRAVVDVHESTFRSSGLFDSSTYTEDYTLTLTRDQAGWRILDAKAYRYWHPCWSNPDTDWCRQRSVELPAVPERGDAP